MSNWIGYAITVNCGEPLGCYQGTILDADGSTITLTKAFRNGFPYPKSQVTLNAADIKDLRIIESRSEPAEQPHSTVAVANKNKKGQRATVCENLQANPTSSGSQVPCSSNKGSVPRSTGAGPARSKPIDIQTNRNKPNNNNNNAGSYGNAGSTPKARGNHEKARKRNEACFGDGADTPLEDFDFEGNLALFDKRALWEEMRHSKPDLVRHADDCKFRHDERVIPAPPPRPRRGIVLPPHEVGGPEYNTDDGAVVPAASASLRRRLWALLAARGLGAAADALLARAAADVALRLAGGARRLHPDNAHQAPAAVALLGRHAGGARGALAARLLASHGAAVCVLLAGPRRAAPELQPELDALRADGGRVVERPDQLPSADVVLLALYDLQLDDAEDDYREAVAWARGARGASVWMEPGAGWGGAAGRAAVQGALPGRVAAGVGQLYLADVAVPRGLLRELGVQYSSPFGASSVLALHPAPPSDR